MLKQSVARAVVDVTETLFQFPNGGFMLVLTCKVSNILALKFKVTFNSPVDCQCHIFPYKHITSFIKTALL